LLHFLKVIIAAIVCLATVIDCQTSLTIGVRRKAGGTLGRKLEKILPFLFVLKARLSGVDYDISFQEPGLNKGA
jgi:hypothetical protein